MQRTIQLVTASVLVVLMAAQSVTAQTPSDIWRNFAERVEIGTELNIRMTDGRRFRATLVGVRDDSMLLQPKTRVPVPIQVVPYEAVASLERTRAGIGAGKAVAIGVATGVGAFFGILALLVGATAD